MSDSPPPGKNCPEGQFFGIVMAKSAFVGMRPRNYGTEGLKRPIFGRISDQVQTEQTPPPRAGLHRTPRNLLGGGGPPTPSHPEGGSPTPSCLPIFPRAPIFVAIFLSAFFFFQCCGGWGGQPTSHLPSGGEVDHPPHARPSCTALPWCGSASLPRHSGVQDLPSPLGLVRLSAWGSSGFGCCPRCVGTATWSAPAS